jgi:hypothetical protein
MKKINSLVTSIILILSLSSKSHSFTNNDEFINFKKSNEIFCKKLNSPILGNIEKNWKLEKKNKYLQLFINQMDGQILQIRSLIRSNQITKNIFTYFKKPKIPFAEIRSDKNCNIQSIRKIIYNNKLIPQEIHSINTSKYKIKSIKYLNPKLPMFDTDSNKNIIALIDTGINYNLKILQPNIAIKDKKIIGFDFWDNDDKPFDSDPRQSPVLSKTSWYYSI